MWPLKNNKSGRAKGRQLRLSKRSTKRSRNGITSLPLQLSSAGMIDVVFLLLIFFLVTTSFRTPSQSVITPIISSSVSSTETADNDLEQVSLTIRERSGKIAYQMGGMQTSDITKIRELLKDLKPQSVRILVKVSNGIPFQSAMSVIALCKTCGHESAAWFPNHEP